ncbi:methylenetetrahydrofolate reductase C-terminal domain-containing protein [Patulibacter sp. NPDC049589]|uniref:methylenetetrahydrofolate reductase C-terminal domain-containing protein n=1 Tax=Patulibacter sp. NPDC049589 TaxID=3154731 RepID=UPI00344244DB
MTIATDISAPRTPEPLGPAGPARRPTGAACRPAGIRSGAAERRAPRPGVADCPKTMVDGPCGGVRSDGGCETGDRPCAFVGPGAAAPRTRPVGRVPLAAPAAALLGVLDARPLIVAELPSSGPDPDELRRTAGVLAGHVDAALLGDAPWARVQLPPALRATLVAAEGVRPWASLNCRDRNRVALEGELAGLAAAGVAAVHCVTGDHPLTGGRPDALPVFDLDAVALAALAAGSGLAVSVAESPSAPPADERPARAARKAAAGADVVIVNHAGDEDALGAFVVATRALAPALRILVSVPLVCSTAGARRLEAFLPGAVPADVLAALDAPDPTAAAVDRAIAAAGRALAVDGVAGVDLSGVAGPGEEPVVAAALAWVGADLGGGS